MYSWAMLPILYRKDAKDENLLAISEREDRFEERFTEVERTAAQLKRILKENYKLYFDLLPDHFYEKDESEFRDGGFSIYIRDLIKYFDLPY